MAPRANRKGFLHLSLVACPVALYPATSESEKISFNQINKKTDHRVKYLKVDADTGEEVSNDEIIKGYKVDTDTYVEMSKEELENIALESTRTIDALRLTQLDFVGDLVAEADAAHGQNHFGRQFFMALETAGFHGVTHRLFDFALRGDADLLQEFAQAGIEDVFVHDGLLMLRMVRMVHHVFAEIALRPVGLRIGVVALNVAVLAAGDIFRRAHRIAGAAERVVVIAAGIDHGRLSPLEAAPEQRRDQQ
jgi:hypothetical protein